MQVKEVAKTFVTSYFGVRESFFETAWEIVSRDYDNLVAQSKRGADLRALGRPLGIAGPETSDAPGVIVIFVGAEKQLELGVTGADFLRAVTRLCETYELNKKLAQEILERLKAIVDARPEGRRIDRGGGEQGTAYARIWSNEPPRRGETIDGQECEQILKNKERYEIFILDEGEYRTGQHVGQTILKGVDVSRRNEVGTISPMEYRVLLYVLRHHRVKGTRSVAELARHCWGESETEMEKLEHMSKVEVAEGPGRKYRKTTARVSRLLEQTIGVELKTGGSGEYDLSAPVSFCVLEVGGRDDYE